MPLPIPDLDDKTFEQLVEEARKHVPLHAPQWTDHNLHDPGVTLIELFAWLAEQQLYRLNRITDRHLLKYLALLGIQPLPASPATVTVHCASDDFVTIGAGTQLKADLPSSEVVFETDSAIEILPLELKKVITYANYQFLDATESNASRRTSFHAFGERPNRGNAFYLGLDSPKDTNDLAGKKVNLDISLFEEGLPPRGRHGEEELPVHPSAAVSWEYWNGASWETLGPLASEETILVLSQSGRLSFDIPADIVKGKPPGVGKVIDLPHKLFWIRQRVTQTGYEIPPRIDRISLNVVPATQGQTVSGEEVPGIGSGLPYQVFTTKNVPLIPESQVVTVDGVEWVQVWDFDASGPEDNHYVMGTEHGTIQFGDGVHGRIPPQNKEIRITYRYGGGREGNVDAETITRIDIPGVAVTNPFPAWGGTEEESIKEAFIRFRRDLKIPYAAVTAADFEYVATATPGLRVARAKAVVVSENKVAVAVVPYSPLEKPLPSDGFKKTVCEHIDMHRLLTTSIQVRDPGYVRVSINAHIRVPGGYSPELVKQRVTVALNKFLSPIKREPGDNAWPFGRAVYRSEVFEVIEEVDGAECVVELYLRGEEGSFRYKEGNIMIGPLSLVYPGRHNIEIIEQTTACKRGDYEQG